MYGLSSSGLPPEYQAGMRQSQQQQLIAQMLMGQAQEQEPNNQMAGGYVVQNSPLNGLNKVLQAAMGGYAMNKSNAALAGTVDKYNADQSAAMNKVTQAMAPSPAVPIPMANATGTEGQMIPKTAQEKQAAVQQAMMSQFPNVRQFGTAMNNNLQSDIVRQDNQDFRTQEAQLNREQRAHERELAVQERQRQEVIAEQVRQQQFQQQKELKEMVAKQGSNPFFQFLPGQDGYMVGNARTGQITPGMVNGQPAIKASDSPALQGEIAGAKKAGADRAESQVKAEVGLPQAIANADLASKQIDDLLAHPGFSSTVGATLKPGARLIDGTPEADFSKRLDQLQGGAFLQAFEALKGGGQITEIEGKKATEALTRMSKSQSEKEFVNAAREYQGYIKTGVERARQKAGGAAPKAVSVESLLEKYK